MNFFKGKPKLKKIIGAIVLIAIALFCAMNEKAHAVLVQITKGANAISGTESAPAANKKTSSTGAQSGENSSSIFPSVTSDYSTTNSSSSSSVYSPTNKTTPTSYVPTTEYSTTNSEQRWLEIRNGYEDGDEAAEAERRLQQKRQ
jgi:hypothetical protein